MTPSIKNIPTHVLLLISIPIILMIIVTAIAHYQNKKSKKSAQQNDPNNDSIKTHFLAGKSFGVIVLFLTTFASLISGYTVLGIPTEAGKAGFISIRWLTPPICVSISMLMIIPRLRRISTLRNYSSPGDFINDRYTSRLLSVLITICQSIPQLLFLSVQIYSLGSILSDLTNGELTFYHIIITFIILMLIFQILGGLRSVAYTDAVQASVMLCCFVIILVILAIEYGGFVGQVVNVDELPCSNSNEEKTTGCLNYAKGYTSDGGSIGDEYYLRKPSQISTINFVLWIFSLLPAGVNPKILQRAFAAEHDGQMKMVIKLILVNVFLATIPMILMGITFISNKPDFPEEYQSMGAFQAMMNVFKDSGGFMEGFSYVMLLAVIVGIISSANSALISVSNLITVDIFKNWLTPKLGSDKLVYIGWMISFCGMLIAFGFAVYIHQTETDFGVLLALQACITWQAFPSYFFGLYTNVSTKTILFGVVAGLICDFVFVGMVFSDNDPFVAMYPTMAKLNKSWAALTGVVANLMVVAMGYFCNYNDESKNGTCTKLSINKIKKIVSGMEDPMTKYYGLHIWLVLIALFCTPFSWISEIDNELILKFGLDKVKTFLFNGDIDNITLGLPQWTFGCLCTFIIAGILGLMATRVWVTDDNAIDGNEAKDELPTTDIHDNLEDETDLDQHEEQLKAELDRVSKSLSLFEEREKIMELKKSGLQEQDIEDAGDHTDEDVEIPEPEPGV